jgi:hypothetical protein
VENNRALCPSAELCELQCQLQRVESSLLHRIGTVTTVSRRNGC